MGFKFWIGRDDDGKKIRDLKASNTVLIAKVERLTVENSALHSRLRQHDSHWRAVADELGGLSCGGVDVSVDDPTSTAGAIVKAVHKLTAERDEARHVVATYEALAEAVQP